MNPEEYYAAFIELVKCYSENTIENSVYEDTLREMFSTKVSYLTRGYFHKYYRHITHIQWTSLFINWSK